MSLCFLSPLPVLGKQNKETHICSIYYISFHLGSGGKKKLAVLTVSLCFVVETRVEVNPGEYPLSHSMAMTTAV